MAEIPFAAIVNMPEEGNRFVFRDATVVDTVRKLYAGEGLAAQLLREQAAEEKRAFVRGKKVFIVLEADLEHVITERFQFDRMQQLYRHHSVEEALRTLARGKGAGIVEYFEREGYGLVFEVLSHEERDRILVAVLEAGRAELSERLRDELIGLNGELARMMFIKGVRDAGATISRDTQEGILNVIAAREVYPYAQRPFKKLLVADDGTPAGQNLKRAFLQAALSHFKLRDQSVQEVSVKRLLALAENSTGAGYPFVALFCDRPADDYSELKLSVKRIRSLLPETYQLLFTPFGELGALEPGSPYYRNLLALKDQCTLVNAAHGNVAAPAGMLRVLREKAPLA